MGTEDRASDGLSSCGSSLTVSPVPASIPDAGELRLLDAGPAPGGGFEMRLADPRENGLLEMLASGLAEMLQLESDRPLNCIQTIAYYRPTREEIRITVERSKGKAPLVLKAEAVNLLKRALEAIETGRNEPLMVMRDIIRRWLDSDLTAQAMSAGTAETDTAQGDSPPARSEGCAQTEGGAA